MSKKLFDDDAEDFAIETDNDYAKNYNTWRKKEELNKLKARYGEDVDDIDSEISSSSDDDEYGAELTEEVEKKFFKTLACLKNKDPRIYDQNVKFFDESDVVEQQKKKEKKEKPLLIKDYERKLLLEKGGQISYSDDEKEKLRPLTYVQEEQQIKQSFKKASEDIDEDSDDGWIAPRKKSAAEIKKEEDDYKKWLAGEQAEIGDKEVEKELKPLKDYWNNPNLNDDDKFLKDYILNKRYLENEDTDYVPTYDEIVHDSDEGLSEDENEILKQEEFEHKFNFRFEEPDQEFIKRYPRTMEHSLRKKDDKRKLKRAEIKERKQKEKEEKKAELKKLQELYRKEIEEKIQKLNEVTGTTEVAFAEDDIEGDFDPEAHDRRMQSLFNDEFYSGPEGDQKPEFPDLDEELEIERWDRWNGEKADAPYVEKEAETSYDEPHCEDEDFNMDCDYDPNNIQKELIENSRGRRKRRRKSKFAKMISEPKPLFDPNDKTYQEYLDEYYKFDCEDVIGDIPCRFKYKQVVPNSFGLSVEEILLAEDRELNRWCSLKKAVQKRPEHQEKYDQIAYERKGRNLELKKKIFPSLFQLEENNEQLKNEDATTSGSKSETSTNKKKNLVANKVEKNKDATSSVNKPETTKKRKNSLVDDEVIETSKRKKMNSVDDKVQVNKDDVKNEIHTDKNAVKTESNLKISRRQRKNMRKKAKKLANAATECTTIEGVTKGEGPKVHDESKKKKKRKNKQVVVSVSTEKSNIQNQGSPQKAKKRKRNASNGEVPFKKQKRFDNKNKGDTKSSVSDARLSAYGINAKKFKNKLKYGNTKK